MILVIDMHYPARGTSVTGMTFHDWPAAEKHLSRVLCRHPD